MLFRSVCVPHVSQVNETYRQQFEALGATFSNPETYAQSDYPFLKSLRDALSDRRSEERREGKSVDLGGRRIIKKKKNKK